MTLDIATLAPVALAILSTAGLTVGLMQWLLKPQFDAVNKRVDELKADIQRAEGGGVRASDSITAA